MAFGLSACNGSKGSEEERLPVDIQAQDDDSCTYTICLLRAEGTVEVFGEEGETVPLTDSLRLHDGYRVGTQSGSFAWIGLDEAKLTKLDQDSEIQIHKEDRHLEIEVKSGNLFFNVAKPPEEDETLDIRTSTMIVGIRGTCG